MISIGLFSFEFYDRNDFVPIQRAFFTELKYLLKKSSKLCNSSMEVCYFTHTISVQIDRQSMPKRSIN
jgi:hypothetical protein